MRVDGWQTKDSPWAEGPDEPKSRGASKSTKGFSRSMKSHEKKLAFGEVHPSFQKGRRSRKYSGRYSAKCDDNSIIAEEEQMCHSFAKSDLPSLHLNTINSQFEAYLDIFKTKFNCQSITDPDIMFEQREDIKISTATEGDWDTNVEVDCRYDRREDVDSSQNTRGESSSQSSLFADKYAVAGDVPTKEKVTKDIPLKQPCGSASFVQSCETMSHEINEGLGKCYLVGTEKLSNFKNILDTTAKWVQSKLGSESQQKKKVTKKVRFLESRQTDMDGQKHDNETDINATNAVQSKYISQNRSNAPVKSAPEDDSLQLKKKPKKSMPETFEIREIYCESNNQTGVNSGEIEARSPTQKDRTKSTKDIPKRFVRVSPKQRGRFGGKKPKRTLSTKKPST